MSNKKKIKYPKATFYTWDENQMLYVRLAVVESDGLIQIIGERLTQLYPKNLWMVKGVHPSTLKALDIMTERIRINHVVCIHVKEPQDYTVVEVSGGLVTAVLDGAGNDLKDYTIIDYDNEEMGICPVCDLDDFEPDNKCRGCGYDGKNNLASAIRVIRGRGADDENLPTGAGELEGENLDTPEDEAWRKAVRK